MCIAQQQVSQQGNQSASAGNRPPASRAVDHSCFTCAWRSSKTVGQSAQSQTRQCHEQLLMQLLHVHAATATDKAASQPGSAVTSASASRAVDNSCFTCMTQQQIGQASSQAVQ
jgi:hypothetical protein